MNMNITFLTTLIPTELKNTVYANAKGTMSEAASALEWHMYNGMANQLKSRIRMINMLPVNSYPQYYKQAKISQSYFSTDERNDHINVGFCNVKLIRNWFMSHAVYSGLKKHYAQHPPVAEHEWLMIYTLSTNFMTAAKKLKKKYPNLKICAVVADLPEFSNLSKKKSFLHRIFLSYRSKKAYRNMVCVDKYVLLTKQMAERLNIDKPFHVMEGIATEFPSVPASNDGDSKIIMYSGTLHRRFGVMNLVEAFEKIEDDSYCLVICGAGDSAQDIQTAAEKDHRIRFLGQLPREEVLQWQQKATVLVNPRQNNEEFTKYSFPSKTMEYLSSGVPVAAYKLDGIPDEYDAFLQYVKGDSVEDLKVQLQKLCELSAEERKKIGTAGQMFVMTQKNEKTQMKAVLDFLAETGI